MTTSPALTADQLAAYQSTVAGLRSFPIAVTTVAGDRTNGLITLSGGPAGIIPEAPRVVVSITTYNFSHDLIRDGGVFTIHTLAASDDLLEANLEIIRVLGARTGRNGDKLAGLRTKVGVTGAPILLDALSVVEVRVTGMLDNVENSFFVGDVVNAEKLNDGRRLDLGKAWGDLGPEWAADYDRIHEPQIDDCRIRRGLPVPDRSPSEVTS